jgi:hypothetical protein
MPLSDYVNYVYMRRQVNETMLYTAQRLAFSTDHDVFGGEVAVYTPAETWPCGFKPILVSEQPSFTGVAINYDARVRLPHEARNVIQQRDRLRITTDDVVQDYDIVGPIALSRFTVVLEVARVQ